MSRKRSGRKRREQKPGGGRWVLVGVSVVLLAACVFAIARRVGKSDVAPGALPVAAVAGSSLGQFPATTAAEQELETLLRHKDENIDLALANWLVAADVPQFANLTREDYFKRLDSMTDHVRVEMARRRGVALSKGKSPDDPGVRLGIFCGAMLTLGFDYREQFALRDLTPQQMRGLYADADSTFLAGLLRTLRGSCVSMPLIYLVIGQRLGMPVHLVQIGKHCFIRWEEPGYRMNIETTIVNRAAVSPDDSVYLEEEKISKDQVKGSELRNLSNREVIGSLLYIRSSHWVMKTEQDHPRSWIDLSRAFQLSPGDPAIATTYQSIFARHGIKPDHTVADLEKLDRTALAQIAALRADGIPVPANVFGGLPGGEFGRPVPQAPQRQMGFGVDRHQLVTNIQSVGEWNNFQPNIPGGTQTWPPRPGGAVQYPQQRPPGPNLQN